MSEYLSERQLQFQEPAVYSSRDFVQVHTSERPAVPGQWYKDGSRFSISLRNLSQNEFINVENMRLQFSVAVVTDKVADATAEAVVPITRLKDYRTPKAALTVHSGTPAFGCPFFDAVSCQIPGLGLESFLRSQTESQEIVVSRLCCSGSVGMAPDLALGRANSFRLSGKAYLAGCRDAAARAQCVWGDVLPNTRVYDDKDTEVAANTFKKTFAGQLIHYSVPMSLFSHLFNSLSAQLCLPYFSSGGDLLNMTFNLAPAEVACVGKDQNSFQGASHYYIIDPCISYTKTQINNPAILAGIEALYRGVAKIPIAPGVEAPMALTLKTMDYTVASTEIIAQYKDGYPVQGPYRFSITIPANEPSCRGILLRFQNKAIKGGGIYSAQTTASAGFDYGSEYSAKHWLTLMPKLRNLQVRIGSYRAPLDALTDSQVVTSDDLSTVGISTNDNKFLANGIRAGEVAVMSSHRESSRLYKMGKHLFSPFSVEEDVSEDPMAVFQSAPVESHASVASLASSLNVQNSVDATAQVYQAAPRYAFVDALGYCCFIIPFESFAAEGNQRQDAFALRGLDLRNITSVTVSGQIDGVISAPVGEQDGRSGTEASTGLCGGNPYDDDTVGIEGSYRYWPTVEGGWRIHAIMAYDRLMTVLPGRTDLSAQFSLIPTGSTSLPGGNPAM